MGLASSPLTSVTGAENIYVIGCYSLCKSVPRLLTIDIDLDKTFIASRVKSFSFYLILKYMWENTFSLQKSIVIEDLIAK